MHLTTSLLEFLEVMGLWKDIWRKSVPKFSSPG